MRRRGLVDREECAEDGRGSMLVLTRAGQQAISRAAPGHVESVRKHFIDVLTDEIDALAALSHRVVERLNATVLPSRRGEDQRAPSAGPERSAGNVWGRPALHIWCTGPSQGVARPLRDCVP